MSGLREGYKREKVHMPRWKGRGHGKVFRMQQRAFKAYSGGHKGVGEGSGQEGGLFFFEVVYLLNAEILT